MEQIQKHKWTKREDGQHVSTCIHCQCILFPPMSGYRPGYKYLAVGSIVFVTKSPKCITRPINAPASDKAEK